MQIADLIHCTKCKRDLPAREFYPSRLKANIRRCRACDKASRERRLASYTPEQMEDHRARARAANLRHRLSGGRMRRDFGISLAEYEAMERRQGGRCAICEGPPRGPGERFHIDHDHTTGQVRGLLCSPCNTALGLLADDSERISRMIAYLFEAELRGGDPDPNC